MTEIDKTRVAVEQRYGSVHAFCRANKGLNRTTVYQVLNKTYSGNIGRQLGRIMAVLDGRAAGFTARHLPSIKQLEETLRLAACERCPVEDAGLCRRCAPVHLLQAQAVRELLEQF